MAIKLMSGEGELEAWAAHGVAAAARARRVISGIRDARARATEAMESQQLGSMDGFHNNINSSDVFFRAGNRNINMDVDDERAGLLMKRAELRSRRKKARMRIAALEAEKEMADERARLAAEHIEREKRLEREAAEAEVAAAAEKSFSAAQAATATIAARKRAEDELNARRLAEEIEANARKAAEEAKRKQEEEEQRIRASQNATPATAPAPSAMNRADPEPVIPAEVTRTMEGYNALLSEGLSFGTSTQGDVKRVRTLLKKAINKAGNQIAGSQTQVSRCIALIVDALNKATSAPYGAYAWCCTTAAKRVILAAENVPGGAMRFAIAFVIVGIITNAPDKERMELAIRGALLAECKAIIPLFVRKKRDESVEIYRKNIGARPGENLEKLSNRWANVVGLYAACCQINSSSTGFGLEEAWSWLAKITNTKHQHAAVPVLVVAFLETAGYEMSRRFGRQFAKLLASVQKKVLKGANKNAPPGPNANLEEIITEFVRNGCRFPNEPDGKSLQVQDAVNTL